MLKRHISLNQMPLFVEMHCSEKLGETILARVVVAKNLKNVMGNRSNFMSIKDKPNPDDKEQSARFIEAAGQVQSDNPKEAFEEAMNEIAKKKRPSKAQGH